MDKNNFTPLEAGRPKAAVAASSAGRLLTGFKLDFIAIGAQRSATTWIYECLREHPQIAICEPKELNFFGSEKYNFGIDWYKKHFHSEEDTKIFGEYTSTYIYSREAARRIKNDFPEARIFLCLRNPIDRFISHVSAQGNINDFKKAIEQNSEFVERGLYASHLKTYIDLFGRDKIFIAIYEDIKDNPQKFMSEIYRFVGVDDSFATRATKLSINPSRTYKVIFVKKGLDWVIDTLEKAKGSVWIFNFLKKMGVRRLFYAVDRRNSTPLGNRNVPGDIRRRLLDIYQQDIRDLEKLLGRDLSFWK